MKLTWLLVGVLAASPLLAQDSGSGYLGNLALELSAVIPPPPTPGSPEEIADRASRAETIASAAHPSLARSSLILLRADEPHIVSTLEGRVSLWPGRSGLPSDARAVGKDVGLWQTGALCRRASFSRPATGERPPAFISDDTHVSHTYL